MAEVENTHDQADDSQFPAKQHRVVRDVMTEEIRQHNATVRSTQWEPVTSLPPQVKSLGDKATAGDL